jgi:hypothetical protein
LVLFYPNLQKKGDAAMNRKKGLTCKCGNTKGYYHKGKVICDSCLFPERNGYKEWEPGDPLPDLDDDEYKDIVQTYMLNSQTTCAIGDLSGADDCNLKNRVDFYNEINEGIDRLELSPHQKREAKGVELGMFNSPRKETPRVRIVKTKKQE